MNEQPPHSAHQFGPQRDFWWNHDYLALLANRWQLQDKRSVADIGCGLGHWSSCLLEFLPRGVRLVGIDREPEWVRRTADAIRSRVANAAEYQLEFQVGDAERLPFPDDQFDLVTCQTLLMHLEAPKRALAEMVRVAKPGGLVVCVEPDNFPNHFGYDSLSEGREIEELVEEYRFWLCVHRGRIKAGLGNDSIGQLLPGLFAELGLQDVHVVLSDKANPSVPPYSGPQEEAWWATFDQWHQDRAALYDDDAHRRFASLVETDQAWIDERLAAVEASYHRVKEAVARGDYITAGGGLTFITWGTKVG